MPVATPAVRAIALGFLLAPHAQAQTCTPEWSREFIEQGLNDTVHSAAVFDLDGPGPAAETLVVAGAFTGAGNTPLAYIAAWTGAGWAPVGAGLPSSVERLAVVDEDGPGPAAPALFACCTFPAPGVYRWTGAVWLALGANFNHHPADITAFDEDGPGPAPTRLIIAGRFTSIDFQPMTGVARWNGSAWEALPAGGTDGAAEALAIFDEDGPGPNPPRLFVGGEFASPGSLIARYDGQSWFGVGGGLSGGNQRVHCLEVWDNDGPGPNPPALYVGGHYDTAGGAPALGVARWDGQSWSALGTGLQGNVFDLLPIDDDGPGPNPESLIAVGALNHLNPPFSIHLSRFSGTEWVAIGAGTNADPQALAAFDFDGPGPQATRAVIVGSFTDCAYTAAAPLPATRVAAWDGAAWLPVGPIANPGMDDFISVLHAHDEDAAGPLPAKLFAGGRFRTAGDAPCRRIARRDGSTWLPLGAAPNGEVYAMTTHDEDGPAGAPQRLFVGGSFGAIGGVTTRIGRWDGAAWSGVGTGLNLTYVYALRPWDDDGPGPNPARLTAAGDRIGGAIHARVWDGAAWNNVGANFNSPVRALAVFDPDGPGPAAERLVAGGDFTQIGTTSVKAIAEWSGTAWLQLGLGLNDDVNALAVFDEDGAGPNPPRLFAGGDFWQAGALNAEGIARWNGSAWSAVPLPSIWGAGPGRGVDALEVFDHDGAGPQPAALFAAGSFHESFPTKSGTEILDNVARWSGTAWSGLTSGVSWDARALAALDPDGPGPATPALYVGGRLTTAGGISSARIARWGCPPCYPDCNADNALTVADFGCFQTKFVGADPYADCNHDAAFTVADFGCFQTKFVTECP